MSNILVLIYIYFFLKECPCAITPFQLKLSKFDLQATAFWTCLTIYKRVAIGQTPP